MKNTDRPLDWGNILFLTLTPLASLIWGTYYVHHYGFATSDFAGFIIGFFATGLSITGGYHRHFAHVAYRAHPAIRLFYLVFGACAFENSALNWAADHRLHHRFTDTDKDPYNAGQGFWYSHIGWIFYQTPKERDFSIVNDLYQDPMVRWQHKYNVRIGMIVGFGLPLIVGLAIGRPGGMLLWGGLIRVVFTHHATFFINSLAHMWGRQPYGRSDSSRDSWWLALLTNGEGYHNFHHRFPSDYRNGLLWFHWDPTKWLIGALSWTGLTYKLHRIPAHLILRARMEVEAIDAQKRLQKIPQPLGASWHEKLELARARMESALMEWGETKARYWELKKRSWQDSEVAVLAQCKAKLHEYEGRLSAARQEWRQTIRALYRTPVSTL